MEEQVIKTNYESLDRLIDGFEKGELSVIASCSTANRAVFVARLALAMSSKLSIKTIICTCSPQADFCSSFRENVREKGIQAIFIGFDELIPGMSRCLKDLAQELGIAIILFCPFKRDGNRRPPKIEDLGYSEEIMRDACLVILIDDVPDVGLYKVTIAKQKNWEPVTSIVRLQFPQSNSKESRGIISKEYAQNMVERFSEVLDYLKDK